MSNLCRGLNRPWTRDLGPWQFAERDNLNWPLLASFNPGPDSPHWYRIFGRCHVIAPWCAAIGSLLYPDHQWHVGYNHHVPQFNSHSAGIGIKDSNNGKERDMVIMDILWAQHALLEHTEREFVAVFTAPTAFTVPLLDVIVWLESGAPPQSHQLCLLPHPAAANWPRLSINDLAVHG